MTSRFKDDMEEILNEMSELVDDWEKDCQELAEKEASFKQWQAAEKKARIESGDSAAKAEVYVYASKKWEKKYLEIQQLNIRDSVWKRKMAIADKAFDAERSREATLRNIR